MAEAAAANAAQMAQLLQLMMEMKASSEASNSELKAKLEAQGEEILQLRETRSRSSKSSRSNGSLTPGSPGSDKAIPRASERSTRENNSPPVSVGAGGAPVSDRSAGGDGQEKGGRRMEPEGPAQMAFMGDAARKVGGSANPADMYPADVYYTGGDTAGTTGIGAQTAQDPLFSGNDDRPQAAGHMENLAANQVSTLVTPLKGPITSSNTTVFSESASAGQGISDTVHGGTRREMLPVSQMAKPGAMGASKKLSTHSPEKDQGNSAYYTPDLKSVRGWLGATI
jgi:hypothetical protein